MSALESPAHNNRRRRWRFTLWAFAAALGIMTVILVVNTVQLLAVGRWGKAALALALSADLAVLVVGLLYRRRWASGLALGTILIAATYAIGSALLVGLSHLSLVGMAGRALTLAGAVLALVAWLTLRPQFAPRSPPPTSTWRRLVAGFVGGAAALSLLLQVLLIGELMREGMFPPLVDDRLMAFDRLWRAMDEGYSHFEGSGVDWDDIQRRYRPLIATASDDDAYLDLIREMLAELNDAHTDLWVPSPDVVGIGATIRPVGGQAVITEVIPGSPAAEASLQPGMVITAVDGRLVEDALTVVPGYLADARSPVTREWERYAGLLPGPRDTTIRLSLLDLSDQPVEVVAVRTAWRRPSQTGPIITGKRLAEGWGYIQVPTLSSFEQNDLVAEFDAALDALLDTPGLVLDLRGNGGGNSALGDAMVGRLIAEPIAYGSEQFRTRHVMHGWALQDMPTAQPRGAQYTGNVVVLMDTGVASSGEWFVLALVEARRVITVGRVTAGSTGNPVVLSIAGGGLVRYSTSVFRRPNGETVEGMGIAPDVPVEWTLADVRSGRDPDLERAIAILEGAR